MMPELTLTEEDVKLFEQTPAAIDQYAEGYQLGRLHSLARVANTVIWSGQCHPAAYTWGYRSGWRFEGRPV